MGPPRTVTTIAVHTESSDTPMHQTGSTYDYATLRAYQHELPEDVARRPVKPSRRRRSTGAARYLSGLGASTREW